MEAHTATPTPSQDVKNKKRIYAALAAFVFVVLVVGIFELTANHNSKTPRIATVRVTAAGFQPATLTVKQGTKVVWTNDDTTLHQVASNPFPSDTDLAGLKSAILNNDQSYTYVATTKGTFGYHDQLHPTTNGTLIVQKK
jgi:plastocyanin